MDNRATFEAVDRAQQFARLLWFQIGRVVFGPVADQFAAQIAGWVRLHHLQRNGVPKDLTGKLQRPVRGFGPPGCFIAPNGFEQFKRVDFANWSLTKFAIQQLQQPFVLRDGYICAPFPAEFLDIGDRYRVESARHIQLVRAIVAALLFRRVDPLGKLISGFVAQVAGSFRLMSGYMPKPSFFSIRFGLPASSRTSMRNLKRHNMPPEG